MRIIKRQPLTDFAARWPAATAPLEAWFSLTRKVVWRNFQEVRATFGQTDQVKVASGHSVAVFDIGGNKYRLIAAISYPKQKVYVLRILTHKEYDRMFWRKQL
ncbi:MAG TPA: type II toxin-antitoxin system HigB family toxin [Tepidisphaeraceae bacterium]